MVVKLSSKTTFTSLGDVVKHLDVSPDRIRLCPRPGTATIRDVIRIQDRENRNFELVDGILVEKVMGAKESYVALEICFYLRSFLALNDLGFLLGSDGALRILPRLVRIPDVSFVSWKLRPDHTVPDEPVPDLAPTLAVEVLSEGNTRTEMRRKLQEYFQSGVEAVWLIDQRKRNARVYRSATEFVSVGATDNLTGDDILPGFSVRLEKLFVNLKPSPVKSKRSRRSNGK